METAVPVSAPATPPVKATRVVVKQTAPLVQSWAISVHKLRAGLIDWLNDFKPAHATNDSQLADIKTYVLARIAAAPADCNAFELKIEANPRDNAEQVNIYLFNKPV